MDHGQKTQKLKEQEFSFLPMIHLLIIRPKSHIGLFPADHDGCGITDGQAWSGDLIGLGMAVTLQRWETLLVGCAIVHKSAGHMPDAGLELSNDLSSHPTFWNQPAICRSLGVCQPISKDMTRWSASSTAGLEVAPVSRYSSPNVPRLAAD